MNIEEKEKLKEEIKNVAYNSGTFFNIYEVSLSKVLKIIDKFELDQQKPVVPQFVADWIEKYKEKGCRLFHVLEHVFDDVELGLYIKQQEGDYTEIIAKAWLYGYTVEKEKLYTVEIPNPNRASNKAVKKLMLFKTSADSPIIEIGFMGNPDSPLCKLTEAEIRKDFEWAWQQGFVKEVTDADI